MEKRLLEMVRLSIRDSLAWRQGGWGKVGRRPTPPDRPIRAVDNSASVKTENDSDGPLVRPRVIGYIPLLFWGSHSIGSRTSSPVER